MKILIILPLIALCASTAFARPGAGSQAQLDPMIPTTTSGTQCLYEITLKTGDVDNAGTDATITLTVASVDGGTLAITYLSSWGKMGSGYNYFEQDNIDLFGGFGNCLASEPCRMLLESDNTGTKPGWYVDYLKVTKFKPDLTQLSHMFQVSQWLAKDESPYQLYAYRDECDQLRGVAME